MRLTGGRGPRRGGSTNQPTGRMSKGQELALFLVMLVVLLAIIVWGLTA